MYSRRVERRRSSKDKKPCDIGGAKPGMMYATQNPQNPRVVLIPKQSP